MDLEEVVRKAGDTLGAGEVHSPDGVSGWFWTSHEDGTVIRLGSTLNEAWRELDRLAGRHTRARDSKGT